MCYCWKNQLWFKSVARAQKQSYGLSKFQVFSPFKFDPIFWIGYCSVMFTIKWWMFIASINKYKMSFLPGQLFLESVTLLLMRNLPQSFQKITNFEFDLPSEKLLSFNQRMFNLKSIGFIWKFRQFYILGGLLKVAASKNSPVGLYYILKMSENILKWHRGQGRLSSSGQDFRLVLKQFLTLGYAIWTKITSSF